MTEMKSVWLREQAEELRNAVDYLDTLLSWIRQPSARSDLKEARLIIREVIGKLDNQAEAEDAVDASLRSIAEKDATAPGSVGK